MKCCDGAAKRGRTKCKSYKDGGSVEATRKKAIADAENYLMQGDKAKYNKERGKKPEMQKKSAPEKSRISAATNRKDYIEAATGGKKAGGKVCKK